VLEEPHASASDGVVALPPRRRSERGDALTKIQAMSTELEPPPASADDAALVYALNPEIEMSSGKTLAQIAHAAVMADALGLDVSRARVIAPKTFDLAGCVAQVQDAGLTEVPPGTITVRVLVRERQSEPDDRQ
jgi:peptidyl-tRNA hydrolase